MDKPDFVVKMEEWVKDLEEAEEEGDWGGVGSVTERIKKFLETHEATGPAKVYADVEGKAGG